MSYTHGGSLSATGRVAVLRVPETLSTSCDQAIFVDKPADASPFSDAILGEIDRLGQRYVSGSEPG
jgi:hypothetical protein